MSSKVLLLNAEASDIWPKCQLGYPYNERNCRSSLDPPVAEEVQDTRIVDFNESVQRAIEGIRTGSIILKLCLAMMLRVAKIFRATLKPDGVLSSF